MQLIGAASTQARENKAYQLTDAGDRHGRVSFNIFVKGGGGKCGDCRIKRGASTMVLYFRGFVVQGML